MSSRHEKNVVDGITFDLSESKPSKTLDVGFHGTSVSADPLGRILQLSGFHPSHGIVVASPYEQFDGRRFRDPLYVRQYRTRMLESIRLNKPGFGLRIDDHVDEVTVNIQDACRANVSYRTQAGLDISIDLYLFHEGEVVQSCVISSRASLVGIVQYTLDLDISVNRASYGQLTEGGPIPIPTSENQLRIKNCGRSFSIKNPHLGAQVEGCLEVDGKRVRLDRELQDGDFCGKPVSARSTKLLEIPAHSSRTLTARFRLRPDLNGTQSFRAINVPACQSKFRRWKYADGDAMFIVRRNLEYILGNCAIQVSKSFIALITDHVALPLGWNRDNYWQVRFLLDVFSNVDRLAFPDAAKRYRIEIKEVTRGHLRWVFQLAQRPHGFWHRSYLVTGRPKDGAVFQLDQQCYPILELADFLDTFPEEAEFVRKLLNEETVFQVVDVVEAKMDHQSGLFATEETPADDAVDHPYHFSSHVLLWYSIARLAELLKRLGETPKLKIDRFQLLAERIREAALGKFLQVRPESRLPAFAYLTDGSDQHTFYHDANDIPTLLAPKWGFLSSEFELQAWKNTMDFAFSPSNKDGFYQGGAFAGLGSVHTRGPWPLGYFQEFYYARMIGNAATERDAWRRICGSRMWDGLFSEAVDAKTAQCISKAWFSWPGAMIGGLLLQPEFRTRYIEDGLDG